jgi:hypothetical protein
MSEARKEILAEDIIFDVESKRLSFKISENKYFLDSDQIDMVKIILDGKEESLGGVFSAEIILSNEIIMKFSKESDIIKIDINIRDPWMPKNYFVKCSILRKIIES